MTTSDIRTNPCYYEKDPAKKNYGWASELVTLFRMSWQPLVDAKVAKKGMEMLLGKQSMDDVIRSFKEGSAFVTDNKENIVALPVFERIRNILVAEYKKGTYRPKVVAMDAASDGQRKADLMMLQNRALLEGPMSDMNRRVGLPPHKMQKEDFNSNVDQFDEMGLDASSPQDLSFFRKVYQKLDHEIAASVLIQCLYDYNEFDEYIEELVMDILSKKAIAFQQYESPYTGEIKFTYHSPETVRWVKGNRRTGKDAMCIGFQKRVTVREFLEKSSGYFDFERDRNVLMQAISTGGNFVGDWATITRQGAFNEEGDCVANWSTIKAMHVNIGYIEWKSINGTARKVNKKSGIYYPICYSDIVSPNSQYKKETDEYQVTYKTWFVSTGLYQQYMWNFGELYHQMTEGAADEYSNYSMAVWTGIGKTAMESSESLLRVANFAFYKLLWGIYESKPNVEVYNVDTLYNLIGKLGPSGPTSTAVESGRVGIAPAAMQGGNINQLEDLIGFMRKSLIRLYSVEDGQKMGGDGRPHYVEPGGIDPIAVAMQSIVDWAEAKVATNLGINALRDGYTPDPKDGFKLNNAALQQSRNATYYIPEAISYLVKATATNATILAQDCLAYGGRGKDFIEGLIGQTNADILRSLAKIPMHRYGMFVNVFNMEEKRQQIRDDAKMAFGRGEIQYYEYMLICEVADPTNAGMTLAFFKERGDRIKIQQEQAVYQRDMQKLQLESKLKVNEINAKGLWDVKSRAEWGKWYMSAHQNTTDAAIQRKNMEINDEWNKQNAKADAKVKEIDAKANAQAQAPLAAAPTIESGPPSAAVSAP